MKLFVTGGAGYIGSVVTERLLSGGREVAVFDNLSTGHKQALPVESIFYEGDIRNQAQLEHALAPDTDAVIHFAASSVVAESVERPLSYFDNNVAGTVCLLQVMRDRGVKKIVFSSSAAVYGSPTRLPIEETAACSPENPYGMTKLFIERIFESCARAWGLKYAALRYFNAAGSTQTRGEDHRPESHLLPLILDAALGRRAKLTIYGEDYETEDGTCVRDYIHVIDLAEAHILALNAVEDGFSGALNLGSEKPHSVLEVVKTSEKITGKSIKYDIGPRRPGDPPALLASSRKAQELLGWQKKHSSLEEIISSAYKWRVDHPDGYGV